ncbi:SOS response-associated peptidase [Litorimonas sp. RW-G-Af-16]|uniref:SOS response-associated peptidase n=1 Tax=Litorimonas sp. RW-G-Af-16 TaxID=3241168 RepID=UPI003AAF402A
MCGRYTLAGTLDEIASYFGAKKGEGDLWDWEPHYNIAPGTVVPVIAFDGQKQRKVVPMRWGLHPHWKKEPPEGRPLFNARVETASEKPSFHTPFRRRRALIPATGWYEWEGVEAPKTPHYIYEAKAEMFAFVGLWDQWRVDEGVSLLSCTILTTAAIGPVKHLHHRMPVRLPIDHWDRWLDWDAKPDFVLSQMLGGECLRYHAVDRAVGSGRATGSQLIEPVD